MLQPGSGGEEVKTRRDKYPPAPSKAATRYTVAVFPFRGLQHQRTKMHLSNKWMHSCVRATATRRDNDEIPRLIERSAVNRGANPTYVEKMDRCCDSLGETISMERYTRVLRTLASSDTIQRCLLNFTLYVNLYITWRRMYKGTKGYWIRNGVSELFSTFGFELGVESFGYSRTRRNAVW